MNKLRLYRERIGLRNISFLPKRTLRVIKKKVVYRLKNKIFENKILSNEDFIKRIDYGNLKNTFLFENNIDNLVKQYPKDIEKTIKEADKICEHKFNFLGTKERFWGKKIKWNLDIVSGFEWKNEYYSTLKYETLNDESDPKIPRELSKFLHFSILGKAYAYSKNKKYYDEFKEEFGDWVKENPYEHGINWTVTMDVAIRAINLIFGYHFFYEKNKDEEFWINYVKQIYYHGKFIKNNMATLWVLL